MAAALPHSPGATGQRAVEAGARPGRCPGVEPSTSCRDRLSHPELNPFEVDGMNEPAPERVADTTRLIEGANDAAFLAEASRLLSISLGYEETLATVADLALPHLGSWCILDIVEPDGSMRRIGIVHPDPAKQELARRLEQTWPPERDDPLGAPVVMRTRRSEVIPKVDADLLARVARDEENLELLEQLGIGSLMVVALVARGRVLGAITFVGGVDGHAYDDHDLALAEDLAARSALAIDNARLLLQAEEARTRAEEATLEARAANHAKSQFLAVTSHEIRTPINAIIGYAQLLEMELGGPLTRPQREHLERIQASSQHLLGLVNEILDLAKVESGQMTVKRERVALEEVVEAARALIHPQALTCNLTVHSTPSEEETVEFLGDADRLRQVLIILLTNACKFTEPSGEIHIGYGRSAASPPVGRLSGQGPWAWVEVRDTGIGIPAEKQESIFEPFIQADQGLTRTEGGTGLGLAIGRQLARMMGGDLTLQSEEGAGSTFTVWLPAPPRPSDPLGSRNSDVDGLRTLAGLVLRQAESIVERYVARLASGERVGIAVEGGDSDLRDLALNFVSAIAQMLVLRADGADVSSAAHRDAGRVLRMVAELHARQRRRLGWTEQDVRRDLQLLREELEVGTTTEGPQASYLAEARAEMDRLFDEATLAGLSAWREG
jgi:signal transduction histidine kinase